MQGTQTIFERYWFGYEYLLCVLRILRDGHE